ncbi:hypothetical protein, partial [Archangium sp.]|uniref:hypothetical protein n=1 Tax=Archangium sp. TaxID=1872627 RepID=UPI002EDA4473
MRLRKLAVVVLMSGCRQSSPEPTIVLELPANARQAPGEKPSGAEAPGEKPTGVEAPGALQPAPAEELPEQTW